MIKNIGALKGTDGRYYKPIIRKGSFKEAAKWIRVKFIYDSVIDEEGEFIYGLNTSEKIIQKVNVKNMQIVGEVSFYDSIFDNNPTLGYEPMFFYKNKIYICTRKEIFRINPFTLTIEHSRVFSESYFETVSAGSGHIFVADGGSNKIYKLNPDTLDKVAESPLLPDKPLFLHYGIDEKLYVSFFSSTATVLNPHNLAIIAEKSFDSILEFPGIIRLIPHTDGYIYGTNQFYGLWTVIKLEQGSLQLIAQGEDEDRFYNMHLGFCKPVLIQDKLLVNNHDRFYIHDLDTMNKSGKSKNYGDVNNILPGKRGEFYLNYSAETNNRKLNKFIASFYPKDTIVGYLPVDGD